MRNVSDKTQQQIEEVLNRLRTELVSLCSGKKTGVMRHTVVVEVNTRDGGIGSKFIESHSFREGF